MGDTFSFLQEPSWVVAPRLLGSELVREIDGHIIVGRIVETEAYDQKDAASHSYHGITRRNKVMFGAPGAAYVYFTYGMHYCLNVVSGPSGYGSAVLIRAIEPLEGLDIIQAHRPKITDIYQLTNGPAKLCQALMAGLDFNGHCLAEPPLQLVIRPPIDKKLIKQTTRIGIARDTHRLWRFFVEQNPFISC